MKRRTFLQSLIAIPSALVAVEVKSTPAVPPIVHVPSGSGDIINLTPPTQASDCVTKSYIDSTTIVHKMGVEYPDGSQEVFWAHCPECVIDPSTFMRVDRPSIDFQTKYRASIIVDLTENRMIKHRSWDGTVLPPGYFKNAPEVESPKYKRVVPAIERSA